MNARLCRGLLAVVMTTGAPSAFANVITDWDEKAIVAVTPIASSRRHQRHTWLSG